MVIILFVARTKYPGHLVQCMTGRATPYIHIQRDVHTVVIGGGVLLIEIGNGAKALDEFLATALVIWSGLIDSSIRKGEATAISPA